jgi:hypothetical protein
MLSSKTLWLSFLVTVVALSGVPLSADAQIFVYPRRPNQSNVRYFDFQWRHIDILVGPEAEGDADGTGPGHGGSPLPLTNGADGAHTTGSWFSSQLPGAPKSEGAASSAPDSEQETDSTGSLPVEPVSTEASAADGSPPETLETLPPPTVPGEDLGAPVASGERARALLDARTGGVRLYFYERERDVAERAAAFIDESYRYLVEAFNYVPTRTLPYILYNSYQEFLQTNIFPIQEGVLGVTSRRDLMLVLPYFGDHRMFQHVSTHEMVHQFTIQKARDVAHTAQVAGDPLDRVPLWYIEGIAEYYAHRGLDPETEMLARDLLLNPDPMRGYVMLDFFEDRPFSGLWTYKIGQARVAFLEETYGPGTIQRILDESHRLLPTRRGEDPPLTFRGLLVHITGDEARTISARFETWLKRRSYSTFLRSEQDAPDVVFFNETEGIVQTMSTSPDGHLMMYRAIQPETGQVRLYLVDARAPTRHRRVAGDGVPGVESLHPVGPRNFDIHTDRMVFMARSAGRDILYVQPFEHQVERATATADDEGERRGAWNVRLRLGDRRSYDIGSRGILAAESPTFSPDGRQIAFVGLDEQGQKDVYVFTPLEGGDFVLSQLTDDLYAERSLSWGNAGVVYASDATGHGRYNLFLIDPSNPGQTRRLTYEERDHFDARFLGDDRLVFSAFDGGRSNIYEWTEGGVFRRTDIVTGLFDASPGPGQSIWALFHHRGQRQPVRIPSARFLSAEVDMPMADTPPQIFPTRSLDEAEPYAPFALRNWEISNIFGILGASGSGVFGQLVLLTNDRLRNHAVFLNVLAFGSLESTQADLTYLNQEHRLIWGAGLFQDVRYRVDQTVTDGPRFLSGERFYGARGTLRHPLNRFLYLQGDLGIGGVSMFLPQGTEDYLRREEDLDPTLNVVDPWREANDGVRFQTSPGLSLGYNTIRYHPGTGPIDGSSLLLSSTLNVQPFDDELHGHVRLDAERYFPIHGRINFSVRTGLGSTYGGRLARQFYLSSFDTLRGVEFGDIDYLLGNRFAFTKLELRFPLNWLVRIPIIDVEGLLGSDFGGVGDDFAEMWQWRALAFVTGFNFGLGPLVFRLHFANPIDIGAPRTPRDGNWITNFSLGWRYW